jgi:tripeptidyl-peptidase-1
MGFLGPWLYQHQSAFRDVTVGTNALSGFAEQGSSAAPMGFGWNATRGWDPVTGLGVPDFQRLLAAALEGVEL